MRSPTQLLATESVLVAAPQLWDTTITAIIRVRKLTEPFYCVWEWQWVISDQCVQQPGDPRAPRTASSHICMAAEDREKQLKVTVSFFPEKALHEFGPKKPKLGCVGGRLGWDSISAAFVPFSLMWGMVQQWENQPRQLCNCWEMNR